MKKIIQAIKNLGYEKQECPRRAESWVSDRFPLPDYWEARKNKTDNSLRFCSYCGSLKPDHAIRLLNEGNMFDPTDKSYKFYVVTKGDMFKAYTPHFTKKQINEANKAIKTKAKKWTEA